MARYEVRNSSFGNIFQRSYHITLVSDNNREIARFHTYNKPVRTKFGVKRRIKKFQDIMERIGAMDNCFTGALELDMSDMRNGVYEILRNRKQRATVVMLKDHSKDKSFFRFQCNSHNKLYIDGNPYSSLNSCTRGIRTIIRSSKTKTIIFN